MRSIMLLTAAFCFLLSPSCNKSQQAKKDKETEEELLDSINDLSAEQKKNFEETGEITSDPGHAEKVKRAADKLAQSKNKTKANEGIALSLWMELMQDQEKKLNDGAELLGQSVEYASIKKKEDIDALSAKVRAYQKINAEALAGANGGWMETLRNRLKAKGMEIKEITRVSNALNSGVRGMVPDIRIVRNMDTIVCKAVLEQHAILKKQYGKWTWDATGGVPNFSDDTPEADIDRYNATIDTIQEAAEKQTAAQRRIINR